MPSKKVTFFTWFLRISLLLILIVILTKTFGLEARLYAEPTRAKEPTLGLVSGQEVSGNTDIRLNFTLENKIRSVEFALDGKVYGSKLYGEPYELPWDTRLTPDGEHVVKAKVEGKDDKVYDLEVKLLVNNLNVGKFKPIEEKENLISNPGLEVRSGSKPKFWTSNSWGENKTEFFYGKIGPNQSSAVRVKTKEYKNGDVKWYFQNIKLEKDQEYYFSDSFQSTTQSVVVAEYQTNEGTRYVDLGSLPASQDFNTFRAKLTPPAEASSVTVFHIIKSVGSLTIDNAALYKWPTTDEQFPEGMVTLSFDDGWLSQYEQAVPVLNKYNLKGSFYIISDASYNAGKRLNGYTTYMRPRQIRSMEADGHEIGAHTRHHLHLTELSGPELEDEILGSREDILEMGVDNVDTFAYPYGDMDGLVLNAVSEAGYLAARSIEVGFNTKSTNKFALKTRHMDVSKQSAEVIESIQYAKKNKVWLILMFHKLDDDGQDYSIEPGFLESIAEFLTENKVKVVTLREGIKFSQLN